jgi:hypothetical protein
MKALGRKGRDVRNEWHFCKPKCLGHEISMADLGSVRPVVFVFWFVGPDRIRVCVC